MVKTLCFDFGNTRLKCAVFNGQELTEMLVLENDSAATGSNLVHQYQPQKVILSSVIHHNPEFETAIAQGVSFHKLGHTSRLPFSIPVGKPETVGADRLAICAAATFLFPQKNNLVIALGSCITYNFINQQHQFMGGRYFARARIPAALVAAVHGQTAPGGPRTHYSPYWLRYQNQYFKRNHTGHGRRN